MPSKTGQSSLKLNLASSRWNSGRCWLSNVTCREGIHSQVNTPRSMLQRYTQNIPAGREDRHPMTPNDAQRNPMTPNEPVADSTQQAMPMQHPTTDTAWHAVARAVLCTALHCTLRTALSSTICDAHCVASCQQLLDVETLQRSHLLAVHRGYCMVLPTNAALLLCVGMLRCVAVRCCGATSTLLLSCSHLGQELNVLCRVELP